MTSLAALAVVVRILANPTSNVVQKKLTARGQHPLFVNFTTYLALSLVGLAMAARYDPRSLSGWFYIYSILTGLTGALGNGFIVKALEKGDLSVLGPINGWKSVVGILFAWLLIGESPDRWGYLGIALIIAGSYFILGRSGERFSWSILAEPAIRYRVLALLLTGIQAVFDKKVIEHSNLELAFASWAVGGAFFSLLILFARGIAPLGPFSGLERKTVGYYLLLISTTGLMVVSTNYAFRSMPVGEALALFQLSILVSVIFGAKIFNEKDLGRRIIGSLIMIFGSLLILLMKQ